MKKNIYRGRKAYIVFMPDGYKLPYGSLDEFDEMDEMDLDGVSVEEINISKNWVLVAGYEDHTWYTPWGYKTFNTFVAKTKDGLCTIMRG